MMTEENECTPFERRLDEFGRVYFVIRHDFFTHDGEVVVGRVNKDEVISPAPVVFMSDRVGRIVFYPDE